MGGRLFKIIMTLLWLGWSCVLVPGHTRGAMRLDGSLAREEGGNAVSFMFSSLPPCCRDKCPTDSQQKSDDKSIPACCDCAICKLVAHTGVGVDLPPMVATPVAGLFVSSAPAPISVDLAFVALYLSRGPPV